MKVLISAGGTGGHIYPAIAIVNKIKEFEPNSEFMYIGTHNRMEKDIVPKHDIPFESVEIYGLNRKKPLKNIKTILAFYKSSKKIKKILKKFNPDVVVGVGGYVTGPVIRTAKKMGFKTFIHEQNSVPGKANLFLSKYSDKIGISFKETVKYFPPLKTVFTGNPRSEEALLNKPYRKNKFGLDESKKLAVFVMGSLGAARVNEVLIETMPKFEEEDFEVLFITGKNEYEQIIKNKFPNNVKVVPYVEDLTKIMMKTDLIISRTGASTLSEIAALGIPSILIPSPYVPNNHQFKNAKPLYDGGAADLIEEKDLEAIILAQRVIRLIHDNDKLAEYKNNLKDFAVAKSGTKIYRILKEMVDDNNE